MIKSRMSRHEQRNSKTFAEKGRNARTNTLGQEQAQRILERKRTTHELSNDFDNTLPCKTSSRWALQARDLIMCFIVDTNTSRPGPEVNMTLQKYEKSEPS